MTAQQTKAASNFIDAFSGQLRQGLSAEPGLTPFLAGLAELEGIPSRSLCKSAEPAAVDRYLAPSLENIACPPALGRAVPALASSLPWYQVFDAAGAGNDLPPGLAEGMVACQVAGKVGLFKTTRIICGLFLLAPSLHYPTHQHSALEIYYVCSGGLSLQHGRKGQPFELTPGDWSITPSNRLHALRTAAQPCLIAFAWVGDISGANWWWEDQADGTWQRVAWERGDDGSWRRKRYEVVSEATLVEAGEL